MPTPKGKCDVIAGALLPRVCGFFGTGQERRRKEYPFGWLPKQCSYTGRGGTGPRKQQRTPRTFIRELVLGRLSHSLLILSLLPPCISAFSLPLAFFQFVFFPFLSLSFCSPPLPCEGGECVWGAEASASCRAGQGGFACMY